MIVMMMMMKMTKKFLLSCYGFFFFYIYFKCSASFLFNKLGRVTSKRITRNLGDFLEKSLTPLAGGI